MREPVEIKFRTTNNYLNHVKNKMIFRRDMASPLSEVLGVIVLCCILFRRSDDPGRQVPATGGFITYIAIFTIINPAKAYPQLITMPSAEQQP
jgi:subfamily B ATP-binding cassette protein MsbA